MLDIILHFRYYQKKVYPACSNERSTTLDIREFSYIAAIAKYQNLTKAAQALYVSQPTLSKFLSSYETALGISLFNRLGNRFILNYAGERYLEKAQQILTLKSELEQIIDDFRSKDVGRIRLALSNSRSIYVLPAILPLFEERYPRVVIEITETHSKEVEKLLLSGQADFGLMSSTPAADSGLHHRIVESSELVLITPRDHRLVGMGRAREHFRHPWINLSLLKDEDFILQSREQRTRIYFDSIIDAAGWTPHVKLTVSNPLTILRLVKRSYGVGMLLESQLSTGEFMPGEISIFSVNDTPIHLETTVVYREGAPFTKYMEYFVQLIRDFYRHKLFQLTDGRTDAPDT